MGCSTRDYEFRIAVKAGTYSTSVWDGDEEIYFPEVCALTEVQEQIIQRYSRGSRAIFTDQVNKGNRIVGGALRFKFGRAELNTWLPRILGASEVSNEFKVANSLPWFNVLVDKGQSDYFEYRDCKVAMATFSGQSGGLINMDLVIVGKQEEEYGSTWPTISYSSDLSHRALRFAEGVMTIDPGGDDINILFESFSLTINNLIETIFYAGSDAATCIDEGDRRVTLSVPAAHTSVTKDLYKRGFEGLSIAMAWAADNMSTGVTLKHCCWPKRSPTMEGEGRIPTVLDMLAYRSDAGDSGADDEIVFTNDEVFAS